MSDFQEDQYELEHLLFNERRDAELVMLLKIFL